jgi:SAM-dependent methyltransferase
MLRRMWKQRLNGALAELVGYEVRRVRSMPRPPRAPGRSVSDGPSGSRTSNGSVEHLTSAAPTVAMGWETWAQQRRNQQRLGDVWNEPDVYGLAVASPDDVVPYLDRTVVSPFIGQVDVIVEIGPGGGRFTEILLPKCQRLVAVDTSATMLDLLRERFLGRDDLECVLGDGRGLPRVADESVDAAFSFDVFVHLQHWDIFNYLVELQRVLRPGGKAIIHHSNTFSDLGWAAFLREVPRQLNSHKLPWSFIVNSPDIMREFVTRAGLDCVATREDVVRRDCITLIEKPLKTGG